MFLIDKYAYQNRIKNLPLKLKVLSYVVFLIMSFSGVLPLQLLVIFALAPLTCYLAKVPLKRYIKWYLHASIFIAISLVTFLISFSKNQDQFLYFLPMGMGYLGCTREALEQAFFILLRVYSSLVSTYYLTLTVPFAQLLQLFKRLSFPTILLEIIVLMYRFIFLVLYEFVLTRDSLDLKFSFYRKRASYQTWARLAHTVFLKILDDNEKINDALQLRYDGKGNGE
ncbi:cobalt ECF transporter T component CbiQ [Streptococcus catagoni]|uniref:cobalt ECF transporter T component CbiQ n=1 Tax=Streptococcus catagoni TaxID=2654874 RepID=UPI00140B1327|nr:cobalt ECF transporter T component CbiQ [Streptococcus catagoni]